MLDDLEREMAHLSAKDIIVEGGFTLNDIRNDGWPRSSARPTPPVVRLSFVSKHGPLAYLCGTFDDYGANLRAIGLTLSNLRAIDRYGATSTGEQYKGWSQLPPPGGLAMDEWPNVEAAVRFLCDVAGWITPPAVPSNIASVYRDAAMKVHPDKGGDSSAMSKVNRARDFIEKHGAPS
jgi:hypothetical protein